MVSKTVVVENGSGFHLRPAAVLCEVAQKYKCSIHFKIGEKQGNAKSVLSILGTCVKDGNEVEFFCEGEDEQEALEEIIETVKNKL